MEAGPERTLVWRGLDAPRMEVAHVASFESVVAQRYEPRGHRTVGYSSGSFKADIEFDEDGFVALYHDFLERVA